MTPEARASHVLASLVWSSDSFLSRWDDVVSHARSIPLMDRLS
jgi:hypothetical protein